MIKIKNLFSTRMEWVGGLKLTITYNNRRIKDSDLYPIQPVILLRKPTK